MSSKIVIKNNKIVSVNSGILSTSEKKNEFEFKISIELSRIDPVTKYAYMSYNISRTDGKIPDMSEHTIRYYLLSLDGDLYGAYFDENPNDVTGISEFEESGHCQVYAQILDKNNKVVSKNSNTIIMNTAE